MSDAAHTYRCPICSQEILESTAAKLADLVNMHNVAKHPMEFASWNHTSILESACYSGTGAAPLAIRPVVGFNPPGDWGTAKPPTVTTEDLVLLAKAKVLWERK